MDPYKVLGIVPNVDGTITRLPVLPVLPPTTPTSENPNPPVLSKDIPLDPTHDTYLRLYPPSAHQQQQRLPILVHYHGGGFVLYSAVTSVSHEFCDRIAAELPAIVVSVEYRLAPEHPLPAAYDDAIASLLWIRDQAAESPTSEPWLNHHGDFSRCYLIGSSSGANIVYQAGVRSLTLDVRPLTIAGLIMNEPYLGGRK